MLRNIHDLRSRSVRFEVADVLSLPCENGSFDAVIEKGVFDVFCSAAKSQWDHPPEVAAKWQWL